MKFTLLIFTLFALLHKAFCEESAFNLASRFVALPIEEQVASNLPTGREDEVIKELSKYKGCAALLRLNHSPSVEYVTDIYLETEGKTLYRREIEDSCSPYFVEKLAPALYKTDEAIFRRWGEGYHDYGPSAAATLLIGQLLVKSPEFSPEVKQWAQKHLTVPWYGSIFTARQFIEINQEALKAQQFDKVIVPPGPPLYPAPISAEEAARKAIKSPNTPAREQAQPAETNPPKQADASNYWWLVGLMLAIVLSFFLVKRQTPR